ncbi:hypothetical protein VaNZ11_016425 [Volvox africanus]|uniref:F-box domain-containing protein n=1 Tax=Volvox africanus TaxID=51714 RepID=A0ABQ5SNS9_9CHLO|nr:hypothetical protein VaNZ11_016425 [Volvox africanus]
MQSAGQRTKRQAAALGANDKQHAKAHSGTQPAASRKQKRRASEHAANPVAKKTRRSAPELPKAGSGGHATPVAPTRSAYNLRTRSSMPASGTRLTDNSMPVSAPTGGLPSSVRPRSPNQMATWNELPVEVLKIICQHLDPGTILAARRVAVAMREACTSAPVRLRFTLPMQSSPWVPAQLEAWERRINGVAGLLGSGKMAAKELQLRMEGAASWKGEDSMPAAQILNAVQRLAPLLVSLGKLGSLAAMPVTHLDVELPITVETMQMLSNALPHVASLQLDSLIPPPHNHAMVLSETSGFANVRKLDICVTAWDQVQYLSALTQLTDLNVRYCIWNIPELTPLAGLPNLTTFGIQVLDDRARFQLDFLGSLVRSSISLRHLRADIILSRTVVSESGPASCDFLAGCGLETLKLDVRVPEDAARTAHSHFRNLYLAPLGCKVYLTIRADALSRETSFESAATRGVNLSMPRLGMAHPAPAESRERWSSLNMSDLGTHPHGALTLLHLRGYHTALSMLPDLSAACLTRLQISNARLSPADFAVLGSCTTIEHLFMRFTYQPDPPGSGGSTLSDTAISSCNGGSQSVTQTLVDLIRPRELQNSLRLAVHGTHGMLTRARKSLQEAGRRSTGSATEAPAHPPDCTSKPAPYALQPLLKLERLRSLELLEEPQPPAALPPRLSTVGAGAGVYPSPLATGGAVTDAGTSGTCTRRSTLAAAVGPSSSAAAAPQAQGTQTLLPLTRSGLWHFLEHVSGMPDLKAVSIRFLTEGADLPDCPCRTSCFASGTKGFAPPHPINGGDVRCLFVMDPECYKFVLGSLVVQSSRWYRPSAWPPSDS